MHCLLNCWLAPSLSRPRRHRRYHLSLQKASQTYLTQPTISPIRGSSRSCSEALHDDPDLDQTATPPDRAPYFSTLPAHQHPIFGHSPSSATADSSSRGRGFINRARRRGGRDSAVGSPSRSGLSGGHGDITDTDVTHESLYEQDLASSLEHDLLEPNGDQPHAVRELPTTWTARLGAAASRGEASTIRKLHQGSDIPLLSLDDWDEHGAEVEDRLSRRLSYTGGAVDDTVLDSRSLYSFHRLKSGIMERPRDQSEGSAWSNIVTTLTSKGAVAMMLYNGTKHDPEANDVWPKCRSSAKLPAHYSLLDSTKHVQLKSEAERHIAEKVGGGDHDTPRTDSSRRKWNLPVELVDIITDYLNRDDVKALRLVSRELNHFVSQGIFQTVVVPFNTEIYGMLGPEPKSDFKGKRRAKIEKSGYFWNNSDGDEIYNGHGLDVFRGFGKHIRKFAMSFEVNEDSLAMPPVKVLTETKTSFWGRYDWPFEEYRRFDAVAGLETAADETPRMKTAFSELTRVSELALSVDSGLGWLNGPDRSIRARILQRPPAVFGNSKAIPDRRAQAQHELWNHVESSHRDACNDVKLATLYRLDGLCSSLKLEDTGMGADKQPEMPYMDTHLIHEAISHDTADTQVPTSFDDPEVLERFVLTPTITGAGILFTSVIAPNDAGQLMSPIIPANLTKSQKEWLLETEWAQRAFLSSYMLSVIDNPITFKAVHTLNISRLSDRYLPMLDRSDFWNALPSLVDVTLMLLPGWRTVRKDEAGFVETPRINPTQGTDAFCNLLRTHVAHHSSIRTLAIGWATGGEHAEGLHGRNRLIMPAPLMVYGVRADSGAGFASDLLLETDAHRLRMSLLHFPSIEQLTLRNCWVTPATLLQFVNLHDLYTLKRLVLDSVSLTAILRPQVNVNQPAQPAAAAGNLPMGGVLNAGVIWNALNNDGGGQAVLPNQQQFLQLYVQTLQVQLQQLQTNAGGIQQQNQITALQAQLQQQIQHLQNQNNLPLQAQAQAQPNQPAQPQATFHNVANVAAQVQQLQHQAAAVQHPPIPPGLANPPSHPNIQSALRTQPRPGSWTDTIDQISPGTNLSDFGSEHSQANSERITPLRSVEFISCGYAKLPYAALNQTGIEAANGLATALQNRTFPKRHSALSPAMLSAKWAHLGEIVQEVDPAELAALDAGWNLRTGWEDAEAARAVEFDGLLPGGTGRFTGVIRHSDRVVDSASAS